MFNIGLLSGILTSILFVLFPDSTRGVYRRKLQKLLEEEVKSEGAAILADIANAPTQPVDDEFSASDNDGKLLKCLCSLFAHISF